MKRITTLLLLLIITIMPVFSVNAAENVSEKKLSVLTQLGICNDMSLVEFEAESTVVKKTFYTSIYNIMTDDEETDEKIISYLKRYNIGIDEFSFRDNITREEALSATVSMLGYTYRALKGDELIEVATQLGVKKCVKGDMSADITLGEVVDLLSGAIEADMIMYEFSGSSAGYSYKIIEDTTPLMYYKDIHYVKGTVTKNSYASVIDDTPSYKGTVQIDGEQMYIGTTNAGSYLGLPVEAYVQYNSDDEGTIRCIAPNENHVTITKVEAENIIDINSSVTQIEYEIDSTAKSKKLQISRTVKVIFNGQNYGEYTNKDLMPTIGNLELIDVDKDKTVDIINVTSYKTVLVNYVSNYSMTVVSKYSNPASVKIDPDDREVIIEKDGVAADISAIKPNDVLLVAESKVEDGIVRVLVSDKQATAFITGSTTENEIYAGEAIYKLSSDYVFEAEQEGSQFILPSVGRNYSLYLDAFGNVAYAVEQEGEIYIYARKQYMDDSESDYYIKAFTIEGTWETYKYAEKIRLKSGGMTSRGNSIVYKALGGLNFTPQLLRVEFNSDGELAEIETATDVTIPDENNFTKYSMTSQKIYQNETMTFGCDVYGSDSTIVFVVPTDKEKEMEYKATKMSYFVLDSWYMVDAYDMDKFYNASVIIRETDAQTVEYDRYYVTKVYQTVVDNEVRTGLTCFMNGSEIELVNASYYDMIDVKVGDVIRIVTNPDGEITYAEVHKPLPANGVEKIYPSLTDATKIHGRDAFASGTVLEVDGAGKRILADCGNSEPARLLTESRTVYYLYDGAARNRMSVISFEDIEPQDDVYVFISFARVREVYVIRNVQ